MWRWILGIIAFVILALVGTCYAGYRRITSSDNVVNVAVPVDPAHAFVLLTDRDSLLEWLPEGTTATPAGHGSLRAGDTIRVAAATRRNVSSRRAMQMWVVREVKAPTVLAVDGIEYDPGGQPHPAFTRRDSIVAAGDSALIVSTFVGYPLLSPSESASAAGNAVSGSLLGAADRMRLGAARIMWQTQLRRLGSRDVAPRP
jgi:hypothetical protein